MWEKAAEKIKEWNAAGYENYHISVNISAKDSYYLDLYKVLTGIVRKYGIAPKRLNLEITETVIMSDIKMHMEILDRLQQFGFQIEIDDFGSGPRMSDLFRQSLRHYSNPQKYSRQYKFV